MGSTNSLRNKTAAFREKNEKLVKQVEEWSISMLEDFVHLAYENCSDIGVLRAILSNSISRSALVSHIICNEEFLKYLKFEQTALDGILKFGITRRYGIRAYEYNVFFSSASSSYYGDLLQGEIKYRVTRGNSVDLLMQSSVETLLMACLLVLPKFLSSDDFKEFRTTERSRAKEIVGSQDNCITTIPDILLVKDYPLGHPRYVHADAYLSTNLSDIGVIDAGFVAQEATQDVISNASLVVEGMKTEDELQNVMNSIDYLEIPNLFQTGTFLFSFIAAVENLPLSVTISTGRKERYGYPLIYVNKQFEFMTGYERSVVIGANCRFLQRRIHGHSALESDNINSISSSLRNAEPVKIVITNYRKDGTPFKNLLMLKPLFNKQGVCMYVIGLQFDLTYYDTGAHTLRLADRLFSLLPHILAN